MCRWPAAPRPTRSIRWAERVRRLVVALASSAVAGCSVLSPAPTWELVKAAGAAAGLGVSARGAAARDTVYHLHARPAQVCIEFNAGVPVPDLLPALQNELRRHAVDSRVFAPGTSAAHCRHWLRYEATAAWDTPPFGSDQRRYLASTTLSLHESAGRVLSTSGYDVGDGWFTGKWASTREKLAPVVAALLTGFEN